MRVLVDLPQALAATLRSGGKARVLVDGQSVAPAKFLLHPAADPRTSTIRARLDMPEGTPGLYPGQFVPVVVSLGETERLMIPESALVRRSEVTGVYVLREGRPELRQLRLGHRLGEAVEVLSGLAAGERVALDPVAADRLLVRGLRGGEGRDAH